MPLDEYRRKRDFAKTPEPPPGAPTTTPPAAPTTMSPGTPTAASPSRSGRFVVQRHRATRLHYDFRLEVDGVLVSWAVPKGPSLDPAIRRMAVHFEDHPIEYFDFEGVIPARQYGAGDVIVWDWGTWEAEAPTLDATTAIPAGELKFRLDGQKLKGRFTIVRTNDDVKAGRAATLAWLANQASFEIHAWTGRLPDPWQPTFAFIDIDPGERTTWDEILVLARLYRTAFGHLGVRGYSKTIGKRGIQVWIPIMPRYSFEETSRWVERVSRAVGAAVPDLVSWEWAKEARNGRARLD